jgi:hypothetical protein
MIYVSISRSIETKFREETGSFLMHFNCYICWWSAAIPRLDGQILSAYLTYSVVGFFHCLLWTSQKEKKRKIEIRNLPAPLGRCIQTRDILSFVGGERKKKRTRSIDNTKLRRAAGRYMKKKIQSIVQHICIDGRVLSWLAIKVNQSGGSLLFNSRYESKKKKIHKKKRHANRECIG